MKPSKLLTALTIVAFNWVLAAQAQTTELPATGVWNGFLEHENVIECTNLGEDEINVSLVVTNYLGQELGAQIFALPAYASKHLTLNDYQINDSYGTYSIDVPLGRSSANITCISTIYRMRSSDTQPIEYAYALPLLSPLSGESYGVFNSFDPSGKAIPVANFLSIYNPNKIKTFSAEVFVYKQDGTLDEARSFKLDSLAPSERRDFALGHEDGQVVGTYRIVPADETLSYGAFMTRFSQDIYGDFKFAFPLLASKGSCSPGPIPASTMDPAINWGEVSNPTSQAIDARIQIIDRYGEKLYDQVTTIKAFAQHHTYINQYLGDRNVGTFLVSCENPQSSSKLLVQSLFYGSLDATFSEIEWAYASQALGNVSAGTLGIASGINTYFGAANWIKLLENGLVNTSVTLNVVDAAGELQARQAYDIDAGGSVDIGLHELVQEDFIGAGFFTPKTEGSIYPELLRVFLYPSGQIDYIMNIPSTISTLNEITTPLPNESPENNNSDRQAVLNDYEANYLGSGLTTTEVAWTGSNSSCTAGSISDLAQTRTLQRINYFRRLAGLADDITFDQTKNEDSQAAALMMSANYQLSHFPDESWKCYTEQGKDAAGKSNLALGYSTPTYALSGYMEDSGSNNEAVGHRRWILYSKAAEMGSGFTNNGHALWVIGGFKSTATDLPEFIAWPPKGYVPSSLIPDRWSFAIPSANFDSSTITMSDGDGNPLSLDILPIHTGYGDNTIVWEPQGVQANSSEDKTYTVHINNVNIGGSLNDYDYSVTIIEAPVTPSLKKLLKATGHLGAAPRLDG